MELEFRREPESLISRHSAEIIEVFAAHSPGVESIATGHMPLGPLIGYYLTREAARDVAHLNDSAVCDQTQCPAPAGRARLPTCQGRSNPNKRLRARASLPYPQAFSVKRN